jgi:hypothetical protein
LVIAVRNAECGNTADGGGGILHRH